MLLHSFRQMTPSPTPRRAEESLQAVKVRSVADSAAARSSRVTSASGLNALNLRLGCPVRGRRRPSPRRGSRPRRRSVAPPSRSRPPPGRAAPWPSPSGLHGHRVVHGPLTEQVHHASPPFSLHSRPGRPPGPSDTGQAPPSPNRVGTHPPTSPVPRHSDQQRVP